MRRPALALGLAFWLSSPLAAGIPATPLMTLYRFNAPVDVPFYDVDGLRKGEPSSPAGTLARICTTFSLPVSPSWPPG